MGNLYVGNSLPVKAPKGRKGWLVPLTEVVLSLPN